MSYGWSYFLSAPISVEFYGKRGESSISSKLLLLPFGVKVHLKGL